MSNTQSHCSQPSTTNSTLNNKVLQLKYSKKYKNVSCPNGNVIDKVEQSNTKGWKLMAPQLGILKESIFTLLCSNEA